MLDLLKKMNYKGQTPILIVNAPEGFVEKLAAALPDAVVETAFDAVDKTTLVLAFATRQEQVNTWAPLADQRLEGDGQLWFAYPKGSSKRYKCEFNRDNGWDVLGALGFEGVRMIAIDEDWSALRFRRVGFIKTMTRSFAMSDEGRKKTGK